MRRRPGFAALSLLLLFGSYAACAGDDGSPAVAGAQDVALDVADSVAPDTAEPDVPVVDVPSVDVPELADADAVEPVDVPLLDTAESVDVASDASADAGIDAGAPPPPRTWRFRAIGGVSMGAAAAIIALQHPDDFDVVGALGGYVDLSYLVSGGRRLHLAGFCPLPALKGATDLNDPNEEGISCGPAPAKEELEFPQDWNHLHYDDNGATFDREFYVEVFQSFMMAFGNFTTAQGETDYLPRGVSKDWFEQTAPAARCDAPPAVPYEASFNAEYNPEGLYPVIPFCDSDKKVTPGLEMGELDPAVDHDKPVDVMLAVDINGNGRRDYAEPILMNPAERWEDVGLDGCPSAREDGQGGCLAKEALDAVEADPNGDDFHWWDNPFGAEGDDLYEQGEPFDDLGLDGVSQDLTGIADAGEGNGVFDYAPAFDRMREIDANTRVREVPVDALDGLDFWFDGGIRDVFHSPVSSRHIVGLLHGRGEDTRVYHGFAGGPDSLLPDSTEDDFLVDMFVADVSAKAVGKNVYVEYGNPNATPEEIADGDGKHVGTNLQALNRLVSFLAFAAKRIPNPDSVPGGELTSDLSVVSSFYSPSMKARRHYTAILPPGYNSADDADFHYPVIYLLHGHGQDSTDLAPASFALAPFMINGSLPKAIVVVPDGSCCYVDTVTGQRECACESSKDGNRQCVDPNCTGPHETCEVRAIPTSQLVEECNGGSLYFNLRANKWGEARDDLRYMDSVLELVDFVDQHYRTRAPETLP